MGGTMLCPQCGKEVGDAPKLCEVCQATADAQAAAQEQSSRSRVSASLMAPVDEEHFDTGDYAGFWIRFAAYVIDLTIIGIPTLAVKVLVLETAFKSISLTMSRAVTSAESKDAMTSMMLAPLISLLIGSLLMVILLLVASWLYYALFESSPRRATPGKILCGLAVTDVDGNRVSFWRATMRHLSKAASWGLLGLGYFFMLVSIRRQTFHDLVSRCVVVRTSYPPVARTFAIAAGCFILSVVSQYIVEKPYQEMIRQRSNQIDADVARFGNTMNWDAPKSTSTVTTRTIVSSAEPKEIPVQEHENEKDLWANFPKSGSGAHAVIGVNGHITTARTVLALAYPAGNSIAIGFFPEVLEPSEITTLVRRGSLTSAVNEKHALLVLNIQLRTLGTKLSDADVLGYTATVYKDSTGGMLNTAYRAVSVSRSKEKFDPNEKVKLSGETAEGKKIGFTLEVDNISSAQGPNNFRWDALGEATIYRMPG